MLNLIFPERHICFLCEDYDKAIKDNLCGTCKLELIYTKHSICSVCGRKIDLSQGEIKHIMKCRQCIEYPHYYTLSRSPLSYEGIIKQAIYDYKYNEKTHLYKLFAKLMIDNIVENDLEYVDLIVPIPLYRARENKRGFNQSALLAKYIAKNLDIEYNGKNLTRNQSTQAQNKLNRNQRMKNISGVFDLKDKNEFKQKNILLVDDIYTTGSTVDECSKLLLENGASRVYVSTIAVTPIK